MSKQDHISPAEARQAPQSLEERLSAVAEVVAEQARATAPPFVPLTAELRATVSAAGAAQHFEEVPQADTAGERNSAPTSLTNEPLTLVGMALAACLASAAAEGLAPAEGQAGSTALSLPLLMEAVKTATKLASSSGVNSAAVANEAGLNVAASFPPLEHETRPTVSTAAAAHYLNRQPQTLRAWASAGNGPVEPLRVNGRLQWPTKKLRELLEVN